MGLLTDCHSYNGGRENLKKQKGNKQKTEKCRYLAPMFTDVTVSFIIIIIIIIIFLCKSDPPQLLFSRPWHAVKSDAIH